MNRKDKDEFIKLIALGFQEVMVPALEEMEKSLKEELASKKDLQEVKMEIESLHRKFDAQEVRLDRHNESIETLEKIHPKNKHAFS